MSKKIKIPDKHKTMSEEDIMNLLIKGADTEDDNKLVLLFQNTKEKRIFSDKIGRALLDSSLFNIDKTKALTIRNNVLRSNNTKVFLGLKIDEELLTSDYSDDQIKYYEKRDD